MHVGGYGHAPVHGIVVDHALTHVEQLRREAYRGEREIINNNDEVKIISDVSSPSPEKCQLLAFVIGIKRSEGQDGFYFLTLGIDLLRKLPEN